MPILNWLDKDKDVKTSDKVPYRLLKPVDEYSYGDADSKNMLIQGDNLEALKALLPYYSGQVKCIYIDPPYNTGSAFEHYDDNLEHSKWLSMMYPRIELLRELLSDDGSLWISIDADESHYLKVICDEVFGRRNFIDEIAWQRAYAPINLKKTLSRSHDAIYVYAKDSKGFELNKIPRSDEANARYNNPDNDKRGIWTSGDVSVGPAVEKNIYEITTPSGRNILPPKGRSWVFSKERLEEFIKDNRIWFGKDGKNVPRIKRFLSEVKDGVVAMTSWSYQEVGHNQDAKRETKAFDSESVFTTPKPEKLIHRIITLATNENDLILDSFLGSGTTCAVAHKMNRRYIGIEMGEHAKTHCYERLKAVVDGEQGGISKAVNWQGGGGFKFFKLDETVFDVNGNLNKNIKFPHLASHIWFSETFTPINKSFDEINSPFLGVHEDVAYYLLYNGILGDKRPDGGNVLTSKTLDLLPKHEGQKVIYGETSRFGSERLKKENIIFKQTPYDVKAR